MRPLPSEALDENKELTENVFTAAAAELEEPRQGDPPVLAWLYTVARRRFAEPARTTAEYGPLVTRAVGEALGRLPGGLSRVVVLKLLHGITFAEIGADVGLTEAAAKLRFKRALEALRAELVEKGIEP